MGELKIGDWVKSDVIGLGFYEIVDMNDYHLKLKCLKIFNAGFNDDNIGHVTCIHHGIGLDGNRIEVNKNEWIDRKVKRL